MDLLFLLSARVLPSICYLILCFLLLVKSRVSYGAALKFDNAYFTTVDVKVFSLLFMLIAVSLISDFIYEVTADKIDVLHFQRLSVLRIYIFSSLLPCIMVKYLFNLYKYGRYLCILIAVAGSAVLFLNYYSLICGCTKQDMLLSRLAMLLCIVMFSILLFLSLFKKEGENDIVLWKMVQSSKMYTAYFGTITLFFIYYFLMREDAIDYLLVVYAFLIMHALLVYDKLRKTFDKQITPYPIPEETDIEDMPVFEDSEEELLKYRASSYVDVNTDVLKDRIIDYLEVQKKYLCHNLNLEMMAKDLGTNKTYLSNVINAEMNKKFRDLIKYYRVKEAIRIFNEDPSISYDKLSKMCGFKNFSSFTGAFKLYTGMPPGEWCRSSKKNVYLMKIKSKK